MVTVDGNTITVKYEGDFAPSFVLNVLAARPASIVDMQTAMANEIDGDMGHAWMNQNSAGTGPFSLGLPPGGCADAQSQCRLLPGRAAMSRVVIQHNPEGATQRLQLEAVTSTSPKTWTPVRLQVLRAPTVCASKPIHRRRCIGCPSIRKPIA